MLPANASSIFVLGLFFGRPAVFLRKTSSFEKTRSNRKVAGRVEYDITHAYNWVTGAYQKFKGLRSLLKEAQLSYGQRKTFLSCSPSVCGKTLPGRSARPSNLRKCSESVPSDPARSPSRKFSRKSPSVRGRPSRTRKFCPGFSKAGRNS